jgi:hypothetical protein
MSEMVERVSRAIVAARFAKIHDEALGLTDLDVARSAIAAMRVPTKAMEDAGDALDDWGVPSDPGSGNACALAHWEAMIIEALK